MDWGTQVLLKCRVYGRQTSDMHAMLEDVRSALEEKFPGFVVTEPDLAYVPILAEDVPAAQERGLLISFANPIGARQRLVANALVYCYEFTRAVNSAEEGHDLCERVEAALPGKFTSIQVIRTMWLDSSPH